MTSVLVTRPKTASEALAEELKRYGYDTVIEPMLEIVATPEPLPDVNVQAVMVTSGHALEVLAAGGSLTPLLTLPCFCVGSRTAAKARQAGFTRVAHSASDGAKLAQLIATSLPYNNKTVLHIAGRDFASTAQTELRRAGFQVTPWTVYEANAKADLSAPTIKRLKTGKLDAVLFFSTRTAETYAALLSKQRLQSACRNMTAIGLSEGVTVPLKAFDWRNLTFAPIPSEDAMVECLKRICPVTA